MWEWRSDEAGQSASEVIKQHEVRDCVTRESEGRRSFGSCSAVAKAGPSLCAVKQETNKSTTNTKIQQQQEWYPRDRRGEQSRTRAGRAC